MANCVSPATSSQTDYSSKAEGYFNIERHEMLAFIPAGVRSVLEIGCGTGAFGALVKRKYGCRYTGVELMEGRAQEARSKLDEVVVANIENSVLPFSDHSFDCLVCNDVLEHLVDPWHALRKLTRLLKPAGYIVASIPNVRFSEVVKDLLFRDGWQYAELGVLDRTHLRFFTERTMRELIESAGAEIVRIEGINGLRYAWRLRLLNFLLFGSLSRMRYPQFGITARLKPE